MRKRTGNIQQRSRTSFRIRYTNNDGLRQAETITGTREDAEKELAARLGDIAKGLQVSSKPNTVLFGELADDVMTDYEVNGYRSLTAIETRFRLHLIPVFGKRKASQISTAQINHYIVSRQNEGARTGTINRDLEALRHTFRLALEGRKLVAMPHVPHLREDNVRTGFFTQDEVDRLCRHLKAPYNKFVMFGFLTGWRYSEISGLLWRNVDFEKNEIRLDVGSTKNGEGRVFPMSEELRGLLEKLPCRRIPLRTHTPKRKAFAKPAVVHERTVATLAPYVFTINRKPIGAFKKTWRNACFKAGLPCIIDKVTKKPIKALRTFHDLRRSFAREMDRMHVRQGAIMKLGGWKTDSVFRRYNIVSEGDLKDAIAQIDGAKRARKRTKRGGGIAEM